MFSVVIPVYNHAKYLRQAVISALNSDLVTEVLLCDDGSVDGSDKLCSSLASEFKARVFNHSNVPTVNKGAHNRLNQLCRMASQPWIRILNSDDYYIPGSFETLRLFITMHKPAFLCGSMLICDHDGKTIGTKRGVFDPEYPLPVDIIHSPLLYNDEIRNFLLNQNFIATTSNMVFTRELFERIGGFSDFRYAHDWDFALRATMLGKCLSISPPLVVYRVHGSNTISEVSPHMDGEITRLFANLINDFPEIESGVEQLNYLNGNRHVEPFPPNPRQDLTALDHASHTAISLPPGLPSASIPNVLLALGAMDYNFVFVSRSIVDPPAVSVAEFTEGLVPVDGIESLGLQDPLSCVPLAGRLIRSPSREPRIPVINVADLFPEPVVIEGASIYTPSKHQVGSRIRESILADLARRLHGVNPHGLPVIFVMPIFLAVGGVERNTIDVIRNLREHYCFIVITTEFLTERQGSLHWQLDELGVPVFDLAEIAEQNFHLELLAIVAALFPPQLVWICNGSPWLVENAVRIRRLFAKVPIIDQQVYDNQVGWITHYDKRGIQSFDYFIAINNKIRSKFLSDIKIPAHRISLIYPAVNEGPVRKALFHSLESSSARRELGVPAGTDKVFIFVGRLTDQKRPLSFLNLVKSVQQKNQNIFFIMVGDGELAGECNEFIRNNGIINLKRISYHPSPPEIMKIADGMVITSIYEGLPIAMLEALAMALPVISTDVGDIRTVLEEYGAGIVSNSLDADGNPEIRFEQWSEFVINLSEFQSISKSRAEKALKRFEAAYVSKEYNELFLRAMASNSPLSANI